MKKIWFLVIIILIFIPIKVNAESHDCTLSDGREKCYFSTNKNDEDHRYSISKITASGSDSIMMYGYSFLYRTDSYDGFSNSYQMQVIHVDSDGNESVLHTFDATTVKVKSLTCAHFTKTGNFENQTNDSCFYQAGYSDSSFVSYIHGRNSSSGINNVYRNVGFSVKINLNTIKEKLKKLVDIECPDNSSPTCVADNCAGVQNACTNNSCNEGSAKLCNFKKSKSFNIYFRIKMNVPAAATRSGYTVFYKDVALYEDIVDSSVKNRLSDYGFSIATSQYSSKIVGRADQGLIRSSALAQGGSTLTCNSTCKTAVEKETGWYSSSAKNLVLPTFKYYTGTYYRAYIRNASTRSAYVTDTSGNIIINRIMLTGTVAPGVGAVGTWSYALFPRGTKSGYNTTGYISESWTHSENPKTTINVKFEENCDCVPTRVSCSTTEPVNKNCGENTASYSLKDTFKVYNTTISRDEALDILLNGKNSSYASGKYKGMMFDKDSLNECRNNYKYYSANSCKVYCMQNRTFNLFGKKDILPAFFRTGVDSEIYAGRYFRIKDNSMTSETEKVCITSNSCSTYLKTVHDNTNIKYDLTYGPENSSKTPKPNTKMVNNKTKKSEEGISANKQKRITSFKMQNDQSYYYDYQIGEVVAASDTIGKYEIEDKNIYPVPSKTATGTYPINVIISGEKLTNGKENFKLNYSCSYSAKQRGNLDTDFYFRNISLKDIFPNNRDNNLPYNWKNYKNVIEEIEGKGSSIYSNTSEYSVVLNTSNMRNVRDYNDDAENDGGYLDYNMSCNVVNNKRVCESLFLKSIVEKNYASEFKKGGN